MTEEVEKSIRKRAPWRAVEPATLADTPATRLQAHPGLIAANEKLNRLDSARAAVQAKLDQARASLHDTENIAKKILAGEELTTEDSVNTEVESAKLKGYDLAMARQRAEVERELRAASLLVCDAEASAHRRRCEELIESADALTAALDAMEKHVSGLRVAGVVLDNRFGIFSQGRLKTLVLGLQSIVGEFRVFVQ